MRKYFRVSSDGQTSFKICYSCEILVNGKRTCIDGCLTGMSKNRPNEEATTARANICDQFYIIAKQRRCCNDSSKKYDCSLPNG